MSSTRTAPPPRNGGTKPGPSDEQKAEAAAKVAAAFAGGGDPLSASTGEVTAEGIGERAKTRSRKPPTPKGDESAVWRAPISSSSVAATPPPQDAGGDSAASNLGRLLLKVVDAVEDAQVSLGGHIDQAVETLLKHGENTRAEFGEALRVMVEQLKTPVAAVAPAIPAGGPVDKAKAVRIACKCLPKETEWLDEWAAALAKKCDVSATDLEDAARRVGAVETFPDGEAVCATFGLEG